ncbi:MAG TPA: SDR family oxidoreductase [Planctomycetaceae bacterium]|nr:SDR family oxidoreductase [Planctomycetaceae bacterium]
MDRLEISTKRNVSSRTERTGTNMAYHLLTGATGLLGRYLLRDLLLADVPVAVLVRATRRATIRQRVESMMCYWDNQLGHPLPRPVILEGDICQPDLGLDARSVDWVADHCDTFVHNAASLTFHSTGPESEPWRSNVNGTRHALDICQRLGIRKFHHVSTAYVAGLRTGQVLETELDVGQPSGNDYERSKLIAETMVREADYLDSPTIYRPSIIVGDSSTGYTSTFHGFYAPLQLVHTMVKTMETNLTGRVQSVARLALYGMESKNFVPVDWVSAVMSHVLTHPEHHGKTYHLTPRRPVPARLFRDVLEEATGLYAVSFVGAGKEIENMSEYEQLFLDHMQVYSSYWRDDPVFDCRNTMAAAPHLPCPHVDREMLLRMSYWAIDSNFGGGRSKPVEPEFDAHRHLEPLVQAARGPLQEPGRLLGLQVDGHGGGQWHLVMQDGELVAAEMGLDSRCSATYHLDVNTFASMARGQMTADQAIAAGNVRIKGNGLSRRELMGLLQQVATLPVS